MNEADALQIAQHAVWTVMAAAGPAVGIAMLVGLVVALFQALTQIQEMTLTFVPKIVAVMVVTAMTASFIGGQIFTFTTEVYAHIEKGF